MKSKIISIIMLSLSSCGIKDGAVFQLNEGIMELNEVWVDTAVNFIEGEFKKGYDIEDIAVSVLGRNGGVYVNFQNKLSGAGFSTGFQYAYPDSNLTKSQLLKQRQFLA